MASRVRRANKIPPIDIAKLIPSLVVVKGVQYQIGVAPGNCIPEVKRAMLWRIFEENMKGHYVNSVFGWDPLEKNCEMFDSKSRFIYLEQCGEEPIIAAYSMFRFEMEDGDPVIYCYEMQVNSACRRLGLGRLLVKHLGLIGKLCKMDRILLTVLKTNQAAIKFYKSQGFKLDETSPGYEDGPEEGSRDVDYKIMSKLIPFM